jgi:hypothetical protein
MLEFTPDDQDKTTYPTEGVRIGIQYHASTLGRHRPRVSLSPEVVKVLRRGLAYPRIQVDGTFVNGLRIWCDEDSGGFSPTPAPKSGAWSFSMPVRRVRGREENVHTMDVPFQWERDETGPVLLIPRLPDELIPGPVLDKLPNSQVDTSTIMARAEKRLQRETAKMYDFHPDRKAGVFRVESVPEPEEVSTPTQEPATIPGEALQPPSAPAVDLKEAIAMVNELVDQLGEEVVLSIDGNGHVQAKRRIVQYIDL